MLTVSGVTRWLGPNRALIQLSLRDKTDDMFWFAFFHECGHVYLEHAKRDVLLEGVHRDEQLTDTLDQKEVAANKFAMDTLIPPNELATFISKGSFSRASIENFADSIGISAGIVVGRLQFEKKLDWNSFRAVKKTFRWEDWPTQSE